METDYATSGLTIQRAMVDHAKLHPNARTRAPHIYWAGLRIMTGDALSVPKTGWVRCEFLSRPTELEQGVDIEVDGWLQLAGGERVRLLRTWNDVRYESSVEYRYHSKDGLLRVWNVYKVTYPGEDSREERWTGNAGFWVERVSESELTYHCSPGPASPPDFESLVFRLSLRDERP